MKASQFYRQWVTDYRREKNDRSGEPVEDGDLLDWIAEKFERGEFQLNKSSIDEHIDRLIELYQSFWSTAKRNELDALENQGTKFNRQKLLIARTQKECYADIVNHIVGLRSIINRSKEF